LRKIHVLNGEEVYFTAQFNPVSADIAGCTPGAGAGAGDPCKPDVPFILAKLEKECAEACVKTEYLTLRKCR
jgi:hypothetical protein